MFSIKKTLSCNTTSLWLTVIAIIALYSLLFAGQKAGSFSGKVVDVRTDEPVESAVVRIISLKVTDTTDDAGKFSFDTIPVGYYDLDVSAEGYPMKIVPSVSVKSGFNKPLYIEMKQEETIQELDKMVVKSHRLMTKKTEQSNSVTRLSRDEVLNSPGATQDPNKAIQIFPCVVGEISPRMEPVSGSRRTG